MSFIKQSKPKYYSCVIIFLIKILRKKKKSAKVSTKQRKVIDFFNVCFQQLAKTIVKEDCNEGLKDNF